MTTRWADLPLTPDAVRMLEKSAILPHIAQRAEIRSVTKKTDLPAELEHALWHNCDKKKCSPRCAPNLPGVLFTWTSVDGTKVQQYAPLGRPHAAKYVGPKGVVCGIDVIQRGTGDEVWLVEGTKQHLAAASYAAPSVTVLGISGANGWAKAKTKMTEALPGLELVEDARVFVMFDADAETNDRVKDAQNAVATMCLKLGALSVSICAIPTTAGAHTGLDDFLAAPGVGSREQRLAGLLASAKGMDDGRSLGEREQDRNDGKRVTRKDIRQLVELSKEALVKLRADHDSAMQAHLDKPTKKSATEERKAKAKLERCERETETLTALVEQREVQSSTADALIYQLVNNEDANVDSIVHLLGAKYRDEARVQRCKQLLDLGSHVQMAGRLLRSLSWGADTLVFTEGSFYGYDRASGVWERVPDETIGDGARKMDGMRVKSLNAAGEECYTDKRLNHSDVNGIVSELKSMLSRPDFFVDVPRRGLGFRNGLLVIGLDGSTTMHGHCPDNRLRSVLPFDFTENPPEPVRWNQFVDELWGADIEAEVEADAECPQLLHEIMGYLLTGDTSLHKIPLLLGPKRSGKGTIFRIIKRILGANCGAFKVNRLGMEFGSECLLGCSVAIDADVRRSTGRDKDEGAVVERMLGISGEDEQTIGRKNQTDYRGRLPVRLVLGANPPFGLRDVGGALASRLLILPFKRSFYGREQHDLEQVLDAELPGIIALAIEGLRTLRQRGRFSEPKAAEEEREDIDMTESPLNEFFDEYCSFGDGNSVQCLTLYQSMRQWADVTGKKPPSNQVFGQELKKRKILKYRGRTGDVRSAPVYRGVELDADAFEEILNASGNNRGSWRRDSEPRAF